jgi:hypothetical protein
MEIKIKANIDYDFEKATFYLAEFDVVKTDDPATGNVPKKSPRKPGFLRDCQRSTG